ncbi:MAG TPA: hypothetical protein VLT58_03635, partial [Polyangia bacterium]|nr:hypothetical protein [Polyangia bacterium]
PASAGARARAVTLPPSCVAARYRGTDISVRYWALDGTVVHNAHGKWPSTAVLRPKRQMVFRLHFENTTAGLPFLAKRKPT